MITEKHRQISLHAFLPENNNLRWFASITGLIEIQKQFPEANGKVIEHFV